MIYLKRSLDSSGIALTNAYSPSVRRMPVLKFGVSSVALILLGMASSGFAKADLILCPNQALGGGFDTL